LRVISGQRKGYRLKGPKSLNIRPTEDRIKESMFNILGYISDESLVLDLCAGTGSIGIEFLSRGAKKAFFVDRSRESIQCIRENLIHTKFEDRAEVIKNDAIKSIAIFGQKHISFDYIFTDPPYKSVELINSIIENVSKWNILKEDGVFIVEHEKDLILADQMYRLKRIDYREYKDTCLSFYTLVED